MIDITEVRVSLRTDEKLKAFVSITLNNAFVIRGLKIIHGNTLIYLMDGAVQGTKFYDFSSSGGDKTPVGGSATGRSDGLNV